MRKSATRIMSVRNTLSHFYQLDNNILQQVSSNPYLGLTISEDLKWKTHINNISKKANSTLGFIRRNLKTVLLNVVHSAVYILRLVL